MRHRGTITINNPKHQPVHWNAMLCRRYPASIVRAKSFYHDTSYARMAQKRSKAGT